MTKDLNPIIAVHNHVEKTIEAMNEISYLNGEISDVKFEKNIQSHGKLENDQNWKGYYSGVGILGALIKMSLSAMGKPEVGELGTALAGGEKIVQSFQDAHVSKDQGDIEQMRRLLDEVSTRKRQLHDTLDQVLKSAERIMDILAKNSHTAPVA